MKEIALLPLLALVGLLLFALISPLLNPEGADVAEDTAAIIFDSAQHAGTRHPGSAPPIETAVANNEVQAELTNLDTGRSAKIVCPPGFKERNLSGVMICEPNDEGVDEEVTSFPHTGDLWDTIEYLLRRGFVVVAVIASNVLR